jgi:hypothetical protein
MSLASIAGSSFETVVIDELNPYYSVSGGCLIKLEEMTLVRYFGHSDNVVIGHDIKTLGCSSFSCCASLLTVSFEADSRLTRFSTFAFSHCSALSSICIPAQVEVICQGCFNLCRSLAEVTFEEDSKLSRIDDRTFVGYYSLRLFDIPARLEILGSDIFSHCNSLSQLIFEIPSQLRQLYLPMDDFVSLSIPDSVGLLTGLLRNCDRRDRLLHFGQGSRLTKIHLNAAISPIPRRHHAVAAFVCLSEGVMRKFRCHFEAS